MDQPTKYWRCQDCDEISVESSLLTAPSPFDPRQTITGCPHCKSAEGFDSICDEPGCRREANCGMNHGPKHGGYRATCA